MITSGSLRQERVERENALLIVTTEVAAVIVFGVVNVFVVLVILLVVVLVGGHPAPGIAVDQTLATPRARVATGAATDIAETGLPREIAVAAAAAEGRTAPGRINGRVRAATWLAHHGADAVERSEEHTSE